MVGSLDGSLWGVDDIINLIVVLSLVGVIIYFEYFFLGDDVRIWGCGKLDVCYDSS